MDVSAGPAALGGMMMCVALAAWSLGRWQGGLVAPPAAAGATPVAPHNAAEAARALPVAPQTAVKRAQRSTARTTQDALCEIHAEISAYRRAEQVLAEIDPAAVPAQASMLGADNACRYVRITGEANCPVAGPALQDCACTLPDLLAEPALASRQFSPLQLSAEAPRLIV